MGKDRGRYMLQLATIQPTPWPHDFFFLNKKSVKQDLTKNKIHDYHKINPQNMSPCLPIWENKNTFYGPKLGLTFSLYGQTPHMLSKVYVTLEEQNSSDYVFHVLTFF